MIIAAVVVIVLLVFWAISIHNNIIRASNRCDNAWAAIDTQLQRRNDLIPNLVNTVKGYAAHESQTFEAVTSARAAVANARTPEEKMQASGTLSNALTNLFAVVENYPELKANQNFLELQAELTDTENRLSYARLSYNDVVMNYNNIIAVFPNNLLAGGRSPRTSFQVTDESTPPERKSRTFLSFASFRMPSRISDSTVSWSQFFSIPQNFAKFSKIRFPHGVSFTSQWN